MTSTRPDASDLGLPPGSRLPKQLPTTLGNGKPLVYAYRRLNNDGDVVFWVFVQVGGVALKVLND